jgi:Lipopolysaccharide-assembly
VVETTTVQIEAFEEQEMVRTTSGIGVALVLLLSLASSGCGYSLAGRGSFLPAYIRTIGLPLFVNNTPVFEVERRITDKVRSELIGRGRYTVKPETTGVDAVLTGEIITIALAPTAFNQQQQATRYSVTLIAKIEFKDLKTDKVLWSNPGMAFSENYDLTTIVGGAGASTDVTAFLGQNVNALERLASEFARAVVSAILESF